jgi:hypothetical protein
MRKSSSALYSIYVFYSTIDHISELNLTAIDETYLIIHQNKLTDPILINSLPSSIFYKGVGD